MIGYNLKRTQYVKTEKYSKKGNGRKQNENMQRQKNKGSSIIETEKDMQKNKGSTMEEQKHRLYI